MWSNLLVMFGVSAVISFVVALIIEGIFQMITRLDRKKSSEIEESVTNS